MRNDSRRARILRDRAWSLDTRNTVLDTYDK